MITAVVLSCRGACPLNHVTQENKIPFAMFFIRVESRSSAVKDSMVRKSKESFRNSNYKEAMLCYQHLVDVFGYHIFHANICLCKKKIRSDISSDNLIVSMTSYGDRVKTVHRVVETLLNQSVTNYKVVLWLSENEFTNKCDDLPQELNFLVGDEFEIRWTKDIKSYKKIIPALKEFSNNTIVTADDDVYYRNDWLEILYKYHKMYPQYIIAHRVHRAKIYDNNELRPYKKWQMRISDYSASFLNFFTGAGGVLYPPNSLYKDVLDESLFLRHAPSADDVWLWAMAVLNRTKIIVPQCCQKQLKYIEGTQNCNIENKPLHQSNVEEGGNDIQIGNVLRLYPEIKNIYSNDILLKKNIVFITDTTYLIITIVAISSLLESKFENTHYNIIVLLDNVENVSLLHALENKYNITINIININSSRLSELHKGKNEYCTASKAALIKFIIPNVLKNEEKVLYLDSDILIKKDITDLINTEINGYPLAAVPDTGVLYSTRTVKYSNKYFNSGVLLLNLEEMRRNNYVEKLIETKSQLQDNSLMDQNVFNIVFNGNVKILPIIYNLLFTNLLRAKEKFKFESLNNLFYEQYHSFDEMLQDASIVHFASKDKPWKYNNVPFSAEWMEVYKRSVVGNNAISRVKNERW